MRPATDHRRHLDRHLRRRRQPRRGRRLRYVVAWVAIAYIVSRGLAKLGTREPYTDDDLR